MKDYRFHKTAACASGYWHPHYSPGFILSQVCVFLMGHIRSRWPVRASQALPSCAMKPIRSEAWEVCISGPWDTRTTRRGWLDHTNGPYRLVPSSENPDASRKLSNETWRQTLSFCPCPSSNWYLDLLWTCYFWHMYPIFLFWVGACDLAFSLKDPK